MAFPGHVSNIEKTWFYLYRIFAFSVLLFLILPILVIVPLSFNASPYFTFTPEMMSLDPSGYSTRWYEEFFTSEAWMRGIKNSFLIGIVSTFFATILGTLAAIGLSREEMPYKNLIMSILISPMIVPLIISGAGMFFFYSKINLAQTYAGVILAHTALGIPFVVITVTATLRGFNNSLIRASASLGANPITTFFKVILPLVAPGVISGALFAFITSFDEVVVVIFIAGVEQRTIPLEMWGGIREQISPVILAAATLLVIISIALLTTLEMIRRRNERLRGITPI